MMKFGFKGLVQGFNQFQFISVEVMQSIGIFFSPTGFRNHKVKMDAGSGSGEERANLWAFFTISFISSSIVVKFLFREPVVADQQTAEFCQ